MVINTSEPLAQPIGLRILRVMVALVVAYLVAGLVFFVIQEIRVDGRPITERLFIDSWREVQCYLSDRRSCCGWGYRYNCPLLKTFIGACFAFALSIVPVAIMMWVVHRFKWYRPFSEILVGGGLGLVAAVLATQIPFSDVPPGNEDIYPQLDLLQFVIPGMIGGFSHWLVAGWARPTDS